MTTISQKAPWGTLLVVITVLAGILGAVVLVAGPLDKDPNPGIPPTNPGIPPARPAIPPRPGFAAPAPSPERAGPLDRRRTADPRAPGRNLEPGRPETSWNGSSADPSKLDHCLVTAIEPVEVPAEEPGRLVSMKVREGQQVEAGQLLVQIDDTQIKKAKEVADAKYRAAAKEASNDINVRYAEAGWGLAWWTWKRAQEANLKQTNTITPAEMQEKVFKVEEAALRYEQAQHDYSVAQIKVEVQKGEAEAAALDVERRQIKSPLSGHIERRYKSEGEWVKPGDSIYQIIRMDRLYVEGYVDAARLAPVDVDRRKVRFTFLLPNGKPVTVPGEIKYYSATIELGPKFLVKAEVENRRENSYWLLRPGQVGEMEIQLK
jgi:RND family efflux transporter MFP subunit